MRVRQTVTVFTVLGVLAALTLTACSSSDDGDAKTGRVAAGPTTTSTRPEVERPAGPVADLSEEMTGGGGVWLAATSAGPSLVDAGYVEHEYVAAGTAMSYTSAGDLPTDGRFELEPSTTADYRTRIVVRRPESAAEFNGTVVVEWLNVSGGLDANPDYAYMAEELVRGGYAWVGVSAQKIGIEGGPVAVAVGIGGDLVGKGLKAIDPKRYGSLSHPGDAYSYDIFTQIARALRADGSGGALGDLEPERILGVGESQSAFTMTTYIDGVQPLTKAFDGFVVHSRGGAPAPLGNGDAPIDIASAISGKPTIIRTDTEVPALVVETETDVASIIGYYPARQDDTDNVRLWEIAGTAHADQHLLGSTADLVDCGAPINDGPQHYVVKAALRAVDTWVRTGQAPPEAPRLEVDVKNGVPAVRRDADGIALGGIRTPQVDVPVDALSGDPGPSSAVICMLLGTTRPLSEARLHELYASRDAYLERWERATDDAIEAGFVLDDDRDTMLGDADPGRIPS